MKAVVQRVLSASVAVEGKTISSIGKGLLVLVGIDRHPDSLSGTAEEQSDDEPEDAAKIIKKVLSAKLFDGLDEPSSSTTGAEGRGMWKRSVMDVQGEVLCVSQFTLFANFKGSKPDFHDSMSTIPGKAFYTAFLEEIKASYAPEKIKDGEFGAMMQVSLCNDGPVTVILSSRDKAASSGSSTPAAVATGLLSKEEQKAKAAEKLAARAARKKDFEAKVAAGQVPAFDAKQKNVKSVGGPPEGLTLEEREESKHSSHAT